MSKAYQERYRETIETMPQAERRMLQQQMKSAPTKEERNALVQNTLLTRGAGEAWDVRGLFRTLEFSTTGECIDALAKRFVQRELTEEQRRTLAAALTPSAALDTSISADSLSTGQMTAVLHLVFSLAEYQLC